MNTGAEKMLISFSVLQFSFPFPFFHVSESQTSWWWLLQQFSLIAKRQPDVFIEKDFAFLLLPSSVVDKNLN